MAHTIEIPDDLWALYDGSPMKLRDALYMAAFQRQQEQLAAREPDPAPDRGTWINLNSSTSCSLCRTQLEIDARAVYRSVNGVKQIICQSCEREELARFGPRLLHPHGQPPDPWEV